MIESGKMGGFYNDDNGSAYPFQIFPGNQLTVDLEHLEPLGAAQGDRRFGERETLPIRPGGEEMREKLALQRRAYIHWKEEYRLPVAGGHRGEAPRFLVTGGNQLDL